MPWGWGREGIERSEFQGESQGKMWHLMEMPVINIGNENKEFY